MVERRLPQLHALFKEMGVESECFLAGWLLSLMGSVVPLFCMAEIVEGFRRQGFDFLYRLILSYLTFLKDRFLVCDDIA